MCFVFIAEGEKGKKTSQIQRNTSERFFEQKIKPQNESSLMFSNKASDHTQTNPKKET